MMHSQSITEVWPGDCNDNGQVNHIDLVYMGLHFGDTGPGRDSVSLLWMQHDATKWLIPTPGRPDPAHSDCNGDSVINAADLAAIDSNYYEFWGLNIPDSSSLITSSGATPQLSFSFPNGPLLSSSTDTIQINLGDATTPVDSLLGFAATISFDSTLVDSAYAIFDNSWLGTPGSDMITTQRLRTGEIDLAATRTDQTDALNGQGSIGGVVVVMTDNLKTAVSIDSLKLEFTVVLGMTHGINVVPISANATQKPVFTPTTGFEALIWPNPTNDDLNIEIIAPQGQGFEGKMMSTQGKLIRTFSSTTDEYTIQRNGLPNGIYILEIRSGDDVGWKKIVFTD